MNNQKDLHQIIERYLSGKATAEEIRFVEEYYQYLDKGKNILEQTDKAEIQKIEVENFEQIERALFNLKEKRKAVLWHKYAAAVIVILGFGLFYFIPKEPLITNQNQAAKTTAIDVLPGQDKAILTLADGSKIILDDHRNENIAEKGGLTISKTKDGQLIYKVNSVSAKTDVVAYNTIETPKGGQYQVILPDGTKVWLNAASSLKYPERFTGHERRVVLTGEAYFEVAKNKLLPFLVESKAQVVEVLGTHFNINSYMDDQIIRTTLLEGSVKVLNRRSQVSHLLKPGQQSLLGDHLFEVKNAEAGDEVAWKDGLFRFNNASLKSILYQLERWYDVKIDYNTVPDKRYNGMVPRKAKLSEVLNMLELTGNVSFKIEERSVLKVFNN